MSSFMTTNPTSPASLFHELHLRLLLTQTPLITLPTYSVSNYVTINDNNYYLGTTDELQLQHGTLVACPLPESWAEDGDKIGLAVEQALKEAE